MAMRPDPGDRRTLAAGALVVLSILAVGKGGPLLLAWESRQFVRAETAEHRLGAARRLLATAARTPAVADSVGPSAVADERGIFHGASPDEAAAGLVRLVDEIAAQTGVEVSSTAIRADSAFVERYAVVSSRIVATADVQGLVHWLHRLHGHSMLMRVREFSVSQPDPAADDGTPEALRIEMLVEGLARRGTATAGAER